MTPDGVVYVMASDSGGLAKVGYTKEMAGRTWRVPAMVYSYPSLTDLGAAAIAKMTAENKDLKSVKVPESLHRAIRIAAANAGETITDTVARALSQFVDRESKKRGRM